MRPESFQCPRGIHVTLEAHVRSRCPFTDAPDSYDVQIEYISGGLCIEAHSLQEYLDSFKDQRISQEELTARINEDLKKLIEPDVICTRLTGIHGSIAITTEVCGEANPGIQPV